MNTRTLYLMKDDALEAAIKSGKRYYKSSCDTREIDTYSPDDSKILQDAFGEVACYRTYEGDIFAWWEE